MFSAEAVRVISDHALHANVDSPLFLYLALQDVHEPVSAPSKYISLHQDIDDGTRRTYAGMVSAMDEAIGNVTSALKAANMWNNCVFVISNGACDRCIVKVFLMCRLSRPY
jgi:arylsulfatase A-like enzyme